jgi:hypothetical protein
LDLQLPQRSAKELAELVLDHVERCANHAADNPARRLASQLGGADINPATDEARGSAGSLEDKLDVLRGLRSGLG